MKPSFVAKASAIVAKASRHAEINDANATIRRGYRIVSGFPASTGAPITSRKP